MIKYESVQVPIRKDYLQKLIAISDETNVELALLINEYIWKGILSEFSKSSQQPETKLLKK